MNQKERVYKVIKLAERGMKELGYSNPKIVVAGLTPHSSEDDLFGDEEEKEIIPAIEKAREEGIQVEGPEPPDTVFVKCQSGQYDIVVAMYHDQGHIPLKLNGFDYEHLHNKYNSVNGINCTIGVPIVRASVDHGTAFWTQEMKMTDLKIAIYADGADINGMIEMYKKGFVKGFTTNPTLMKKAGVKSYTQFAKEAVRAIPDMPISFEVFADDFETMKKEALILSQYGENVFVKIPITNSRGESSVPLISELSKEGVNLNITALFTPEQAEAVLKVLKDGTENIVSVFAGRIADAGVDPEVIMKQIAEMCRQKNGVKSLWASCREVFNIIQAERSGENIITVTNDLLAKLGNLGKDLETFSLETVQMFVRDGMSLGFFIDSH